MNNRYNPDNHDYMEGERELAELYKKVRADTSASADAKVLAASRTSRKPRWTVPSSLAAGLVLGIVVTLVAQPWLSTVSPQQEPLDAPLVLRGGAPNAENWLNEIADLIREGRVEEAEAELQAFRQRYPTYDRTTRLPGQ